MTNIDDVIIIGAGPAGMTSALYALRSELKVTLIESGLPGGQMNNTAEIENYPGYTSIQGLDLADAMFTPLEDLGVNHVYDEVVDIVDHKTHKEVITAEGTYLSKTVIIATGSVHKKLNVPGEDTYSARGVSYCAVCDGAFFKGKEIVVIGGGDSAVEEAIFLSRFGHVTIMHRRDTLRAQTILQKRAFDNPNIDFIWNAVPEEIKGDDKKVTAVAYLDKTTGEHKEIAAGGVFIYVGLVPITAFTRSLTNITDETGWISTDEYMETSTPGVYAVGDVRQTDLRQITTAVGDGARAAQSAYKFIENSQ